MNAALLVSIAYVHIRPEAGPVFNAAVRLSQDSLDLLLRVATTLCLKRYISLKQCGHVAYSLPERYKQNSARLSLPASVGNIFSC